LEVRGSKREPNEGKTKTVFSKESDQGEEHNGLARYHQFAGLAAGPRGFVEGAVRVGIGRGKGGKQKKGSDVGLKIKSGIDEWEL